MNKLKISVITPSFNQGHFLEETILSVINQNYENLEYIIIDGGSTDKSIEIIKKYEKHLKYWISEKDSGQSEAINKGFRKATGEIICWLNSDDTFLPNTLKIVNNLFQTKAEIDLLNGNTIIIDKNSNIKTGLFILKQRKWYAYHGIFYINQPAMFWKRNIFDSIGFLREDFHASMDLEFMIRIFNNNYIIGQTNKFLAGFRVHDLAKSSLGCNNEAYIRDLKELQNIHGENYARKHNYFYKIIYGIDKTTKGLYLKNLLFSLKWKGKSLIELNNKIKKES
jgi:glycosyltransferase involved in cell wall biosynthesis